MNKGFSTYYIYRRMQNNGVLAAVPLKRDMYTIMFSYPLTWVVTTLLFVVYYRWFSQLKAEKGERGRSLL